MLDQLTSTEFDLEVTLVVPVKNSEVTLKFDLEVERIEQDELDGFKNDKDLVKRVLKGWKKTVKDKDGSPLAFDEEGIKKLLNVPGLIYQTSLAYHARMAGFERLKNS